MAGMCCLQKMVAEEMVRADIRFQMAKKALSRRIFYQKLCVIREKMGSTKAIFKDIDIP